MKDTKISLAVAMVIYPEYELDMPVHPSLGDAIRLSDKSGRTIIFNYKDKTCAWDMAVWLAKQYNNDDLKGMFDAKIKSVRLRTMLETENPQQELAMAILELMES